MVVIPAIAAAIGLFYYLMSGRYVSTDNAYVAAQKVLITPEVSGKVLRIAVVEGQKLAPGEELFSIDPEPYRLAALEAEARLARVKTDFDTIKSSGSEPRKADRASRESVAANQADYDRKTGPARQPYQHACRSRQVEDDAAGRQGAARAAAAAGGDRAQSAAGRHGTARSNAIPSIWRQPSRSSAPSATSPIPCCARPSPASPRR